MEKGKRMRLPFLRPERYLRIARIRSEVVLGTG